MTEEEEKEKGKKRRSRRRRRWSEGEDEDGEEKTERRDPGEIEKRVKSECCSIENGGKRGRGRNRRQRERVRETGERSEEIKKCFFSFSQRKVLKCLLFFCLIVDILFVQFVFHVKKDRQLKQEDDIESRLSDVPVDVPRLHFLPFIFSLSPDKSHLSS